MKSSSPSPLLVTAIVFVLRYLFLYFAYSFFTPAVLFCVAAGIMTAINSNGGEMYLLQSPVVSWLGFGEPGSYGEGDILGAYAKVSFIIMIIEEVGGWIIKKLHIQVPRIKHSWLFSGYTVLTLFLLLYIFSAFLPSAKPGAVSVIPTFVFLWFFVMVLYIVSRLLRSLAKHTLLFKPKR